MICHCCNKEVTFVSVPIEDRLYSEAEQEMRPSGKRRANEDINERVVKKQRLCVDVVVSVVVHR